MFDMMAFFSGTLLSIMLQLNQGLSTQYGAYRAALYIHMVGAAFALLVLLRRKDLRAVFRRVPPRLYLGGVFGVITMLCNNLSYGHISLTSIMSLGIFAQLVLSALADRFGWLSGAGRRGGGGLGLAVSALGVIWLLDASVQSGGLSILLSLAAGATVIFTRSINAKLAAQIGELQSAMMNYLSGLPLCLLLAVCAEVPAAEAPVQPWLWLGGILGVMNVLLCNLLVPRLSASRLTMLALCGQLLCGVLLDLLCNDTLDPRGLLACATIAAGILIDRAGRYLKDRQRAQDALYRQRISAAEQRHRAQVYGTPTEARKKAAPAPGRAAAPSSRLDAPSGRAGGEAD